MTGTLYLVPNLLGVVAARAVLPARTIEIARRLSHWIVETPKPARAFLKSLGAARADRAILRSSSWPTSRRPTRDSTSCSRLRARPRRRACCPTPDVPASPIRALRSSRPRTRRRFASCRWSARRRPARADGVRHERPGLRVPRLPAGEAASARAALRATRSSVAHARGACADLHRDALSQCGDARRACDSAAADDARLRRGRPHAADRERSSRRSAVRDWRRAASGARLMRSGRRSSCCRLRPTTSSAVLDVALEHPVLEALLLVHRLGDVVERHDAVQRRAVHHRNVARVTLEHRAAQLHHVERGRGGQRLALVDVADPDVAERALGARRALAALRRTSACRPAGRGPSPPASRCRAAP